MSLPSNRQFYKQYAQSGYLDKINPEFHGISKRYYDEKRQHAQVHSIKHKLDKAVAYMQRVQHKLELNLNKKKHELKMAINIQRRLQQDARMKEAVDNYLNNLRRNNQAKATMIRSDTTSKLEHAKNYMSEHRRSLANLNRNQNLNIKHQRLIKRAKEYDNNRSRVVQISTEKKQIREHCKQFHQTKNTQSLKHYLTRINSVKKFQEQDNDQIKELERRLVDLDMKKTTVRDRINSISSRIEQVSRQSKLENSLVRSRLRSRSRSSTSLSTYFPKQPQIASTRLSQQLPSK